MKRILLFSTFYLACHIQAFAQTAVPGKLKIGDYAPNVELYNVKNYLSKNAQLKDLVKGKKLLVIDFWNRGCSVCIGAMPKTEGLQRKFDVDIQIIYVLHPLDSLHYETLRSRIPNVRNLKLPNVIGNRVLYKHLFPHGADPYQVWLDPNLKVLASSDQIELNETNLQHYLNGEMSNFPSSGTDAYLSGYFQKPYLSLLDMKSHIGKDKVLNYSLITKSTKGLIVGNKGDLTDSVTGNTIGLKYLNLTVRELYDRTYPIIENSNGGVLMNTKDAVFYDYDKQKEDIGAYTYCYESYFHDQFDYQKARKKLRSDLDQHFNLTSTVEVIPSKCLVLSIIDSVKFKKLKSKFKSISDENGFKVVGPSTYIPPSGKGLVIEGQSLSTIGAYLQKRYKGRFHIIDEIRGGIFDAFDIDLKLSSSLEDLKSLQKELLRYGVSLKGEVRPLKFLVVRDAI